jgi:hypothetical protein
MPLPLAAVYSDRQGQRRRAWDYTVALIVFAELLAQHSWEEVQHPAFSVRTPDAGLALDDRDHLRRHPTFFQQAPDPQQALQPQRDVRISMVDIYAILTDGRGLLIDSPIVSVCASVDFNVRTRDPNDFRRSPSFRGIRNRGQGSTNVAFQPPETSPSSSG